jgi:hypothetical protein
MEEETNGLANASGIEIDQLEVGQVAMIQFFG